MTGLVADALLRLRLLGVHLDPGLSDQEVKQVQDSLGFTFGPEHREFLQSALPVGDNWPNWRNGSVDELRARLAWPIDSVVFDVHHDTFWPSSWGPRPNGEAESERWARARLGEVPRLIPLFGHRYLASDPQYRPSPVFSVYQTDVICYGTNVLNWVENEFGGRRLPVAGAATRVPFWSDLAEGVESESL